jgi:hypothetical protein
MRPEGVKSNNKQKAVTLQSTLPLREEAWKEN